MQTRSRARSTLAELGSGPFRIGSADCRPGFRF